MSETPEHAEYRQYSCQFCGHIYDEEEGDPDSGIAPGTRLEDIPDDWCCPMCSAGKADFELI
jgi:rubredoxin-NAD+ reductase